MTIRLSSMPMTPASGWVCCGPGWRCGSAGRPWLQPRA